MNTYPDKKVIRWFSTLAKTAGIIPGFAIKYADHPKRVLYLLNKATNGQF
ncbi:MAG: hypothetical protein LBD11_03720 [Candidatus Peribacteria bacterium]|jgi:hypothetical protein|nr:hypothetical protein [Candidatus Peribacteria bacterium]